MRYDTRKDHAYACASPGNATPRLQPVKNSACQLPMVHSSFYQLQAEMRREGGMLAACSVHAVCSRLGSRQTVSMHKNIHCYRGDEP